MSSLRKQDIETPALLMDLDVLEHNLSAMAEFSRQSRIALRPHFKNHAILELAARQIESGAIGITAARVRHAEALAEHGIPSILIASEVVDQSSVRRLAEVSRRAEVILAVDHPRVINDIGRIVRDTKTNLHVVVDLDIGLGRCGVPPDQCLTLARQALGAGLRVRGIMGYEGHLQRLPDTEETRRQRIAAASTLAWARQQLEQNGIPVDIVTAGGTGSRRILAQVPGITEVQVGSYMLMETLYTPFAPEFRLGLTVLATVISKKEHDHIVLDAGLKALSSEKGLSSIKDRTGLSLTTLHAEHSIVRIADPSAQVEVGDRIEYWVTYSDATLHLHRKLYGIRNEMVERVFHIEE